MPFMNGPTAILGYHIQQLPTGTYTLTAPSAQVLCEGSLALCTSKRLDKLTTIYGHGHPNMTAKTHEGRQYWCDMFAHAGWRIQRNVFTQHCRLLSPTSHRKAWGSYEACRTAMERYRLEQDLRWPRKRLIILLHGILRTHGSMKGLGRDLENSSRTSFSMTYPSTRMSVHEAASHFAHLINNLDGIDEIDIVTHSMGALVTRGALQQLDQQAPSIHRLAFLGPPSQGSQLAEGMHDWWLYQAVTGPAGQNVRPQEAQQLPPPDYPTLIVAGNKGFGLGRLRGIGPDSDGTVTVEEASFPGARLVILPVGHTRIMHQPSVREVVNEWLNLD